MSTAEENLFETAKKAVQNGERERARDLFARLLKLNPKKAEYWLWMSAVVGTSKEQQYCFREAQKLDPKNPLALRGLTMMGAIPINEKDVIPIEKQKQNWQSAYPDMSRMEKLILAPVWVQIATLVGFLASTALVVYLLFIGANYFNVTGIFARATSTPNLPPTFDPNRVTETSTITPTFPGPTPLWMVMQATYTPTAFYVNTPHPRTEDYRVAMAAFSQEDWETALTYFELVKEEEPDAADIHYYLAECYRLKGDLESALISYEISMQFDRQFAPAYVGRARASLLLDEPPLDSIHADLNKAVRLDPAYLEAYILLANISLPENPKAALDFLDLALELNPDSPLVHTALAKTYLILEEPDLALQSAQAANALDITYLPAYRLIAEAYIALEKPEDALSFLMTYTLYESDDMEAKGWLAESYFATQETDLAVTTLKEILKSNSKHYQANYQLGVYYFKEENLVLAAQYIDNALIAEPRSFEANLVLGQLQLLLDKPGPAYETLGYAFGLAGNDRERSSALYYRAQSLELLNEINAAIRDWKHILELDQDEIPSEYIEKAKERIKILKPVSLTPTKTTTRLIDTRVPTWTKRPTDTRVPTRTIRSTSTPKISITPSQTITSTPTPNASPSATSE